jgi:hypothetical protein
MRSALAPTWSRGRPGDENISGRGITREALPAKPIYCSADDIGVDPELRALEREANVLAARTY